MQHARELASLLEEVCGIEGLTILLDLLDDYEPVQTRLVRSRAPIIPTSTLQIMQSSLQEDLMTSLGPASDYEPQGWMTDTIRETLLLQRACIMSYLRTCSCLASAILDDTATSRRCWPSTTSL